MNASMVIHILAGGSSRRMGVDKALLELKGVTLLDWGRLTAESLGCPVHTIRKDLQPGKGPLAGVETGLKQWDASLHVFMSCDMPFVSVPTLKDLVSVAMESGGMVCMQMDERRGFPMVIPRRFLPMIQSELAADRRSLYALFHHPETKVFQWSDEDRMEAFNINRPSEFESARTWISRHQVCPPVVRRVGALLGVGE